MKNYCSRDKPKRSLLYHISETFLIQTVKYGTRETIIPETRQTVKYGTRETIIPETRQTV